MVTHAVAVVKLSKDPSNARPRPTFSLDTGIILPLYVVATKCRHPTNRRRSIALLKSTPRQEGVLDSLLTGRVAERLAEIEEEGVLRILNSLKTFRIGHGYREWTSNSIRRVAGRTYSTGDKRLRGVKGMQ
jgi:hypothetical protein